MREIEKFHPNLEGHSVLVIEDYAIATDIVWHLEDLERMKVIYGGNPELGKDNKPLRLVERLRNEKLEAVVIHPYNNVKSVEEIIEAYREGYKVVVITGTRDVDKNRNIAFEKIGELGIA